ncbi:chaoptin-like [Culicoides brevitarsis]|uniref:chaoptin-like n=1 Tax=Culicoides brevitarsis TaxID=469753 RepID=UPI00307C95B7
MLKNLFVFLLTFYFCQAFIFFECDESKGNGFQPPTCKISNIRVRGKPLERIEFSQKGLMTSMEFVNSEVWYLPRELFRQMPMQYLYAHGVSLQKLPPHTFKYATDLKEFHASNNKIRKLLKGTFFGAINLRTIDLSDNWIDFIHPQAFGDLEFLRFISLANNNLRKVDATWFESERLTHINLRNNFLASAELDFSDKLSLTDLDLSAKQGDGSSMTELVIHLDCMYMRNLDVSHNTALKRFKVTCQNESVLEMNLHVDDTSLGFNTKNALEVDPKLDVKVLSLGNNLYFNPEELTNLKNLRQLNLEGNSFKLETFLQNLTNLEILNLRASKFDVTAIKSLKNLKKLSLAKNDLKKVDFKSFGVIPTLTELDLSENQLSHLSIPDLMKAFPALELLDLSQNRFSGGNLDLIQTELEANFVLINV